MKQTMKQPVFDLGKMWDEIPIGKHNAVSYAELMIKWQLGERAVRYALHQLSTIDTGDNYVLIRSSRGNGFYRTDDLEEIERYKKEITSRGLNVLATAKKAKRVLQQQGNQQLSFTNNLQQYRNARNLQQTAVVAYMKAADPSFDKVILSKMENGACLPTPAQLYKLAELYQTTPDELIQLDAGSL